METPCRNEVTTVLTAAASGEKSAIAALLPLVYRELRALAGNYFRIQGAGHTLQPTALVHEAYLKLIGSEDGQWETRAHFFAVAAKAMRQILADHARRKRSAKRGGGEQQRVTLSGLITPAAVESEVDLLALDEALAKLAEVYPEQARVVELRFLAGLTVEEAVAVLGVAERTVKRRWRMARAWLRRELGETGET